MANQNPVKKIAQIQALMNEQKWQKALDELKKLDLAYPDTPAVLTAMGDCQIYLQNLEAAIPVFKRVTELQPDSIEAFNNLGVAYMFAQDYARSEEAYLEALQFQPDHLQTIKNLAFLYFQQDARAGDAATLLASVVRRDPSDCEALYLMGKCYQSGGDFESARLCFERLIANDPESPLANEARLLLQPQ